MNKIELYKQALKDWKILTNKFSSIEDKSIENIKTSFANQIEYNQVFFIIKQGIVKVYLQTDNCGNSYLQDTFVIETDKFIKAFVSADDIKNEFSFCENIK